jgi:hypothetical protein
MLVFQEWMNANERRNYPLHTAATRLDADGKLLPNNLVVDLQIWLPLSAGRLAYISSAGVSPSLVTLTLLACPDNPFCPASSSSPSFVPLAVLSVPKPVTRYKAYQLSPLYPGVGGWVAFGEGCESDETLSLRFSGPEATVLTDRAVRAYMDSPVNSVGKYGSTVLLHGLVRLKGEAGISVTRKEQRVIEGVSRDVAVVAMDLSQAGVQRLADFAGACGHRPQNRNCNKTPIQEINGVTPDGNGNIAIVFEGNQLVGDIGNGMVLDYPVGVAEVWPTISPDKLFVEPPWPSSSSSSSQSSSSSSSSASSPSETPVTPEYCENFAGGSGDFRQRQPIIVPPVYGFTVQTVGSGKRYVSQPGLPGAEQFSVVLNRPLDPAVAYDLVAVVKPRTVGTGEGHLVYAYKTDVGFFMAGLVLKAIHDPGGTLYPNGAFFFARRLISGGSDIGTHYNLFTGGVFAPPVPLIETDYRVSLHVYKAGPNYLARLYVQWCDGGEQVFDQTFAHPLAIPIGYAGLGVVDSETEFGEYGINCPYYSSSSSSYCP